MSWGVATQNGVSVSLASIVSLSCGATEFSPAALFTSGVQGAWYDPSDYTTLFQDSAGTTPVTAVEQPVGLMLDKSQGLVLGSELVTNGDFSNGSTGWTLSNSSVVNNALNCTAGAAFSLAVRNISVVAGQTYLVSLTVTNYVSGSVAIQFGVGTNVTSPFFNANGTWTARIVAGSGNTEIRVISSSSGFVATVDDVSAKLLPGNHALQATAASRPVLRARYNLLTYSEQFDNAAWAKGNSAVSANATIAPDGTTTADLLYPSTSGTLRWIYQALSVASAVYSRSVYAKAQNKSVFYIDATGSGTVIAYFNLSSGTVGTVPAGYTATITAVGSGWYRCTMSNTSAASSSFGGVYGVADADGSTTVTANGTDGIYLWGAQLVTGSSAGTYQQIAAATSYNTVGFLPYLSLDGVDDSYGTNSINFTTTDKMAVVAGVTKLSDAAAALLTEFSSNSTSNAGAFYIAAPDSSPQRYSVLSRGNAAAAANQLASTTSSTYLAPVTNVVTGTFDISGDSNILRLNGTQINQATGDQGTGNYGNYPLYIGRRANASLPFNGRIYQMVVCGKALNADELASTEAYVNTKTGAY